MRKEQTSSEAQNTGAKTSEDGEVSPLSPHRAFVVQFRSYRGQEQALFTGRVEHLVSGQAARFHSLEGLDAFFKQVLGDVEQEPCEDQ